MMYLNNKNSDRIKNTAPNLTIFLGNSLQALSQLGFCYLALVFREILENKQ